MKTTDKQRAKKIIQDLIIYFEQNKVALKSSQNETETRNQLINPFFEALGWDINNKNRIANHQRDVIHEDFLNIAGKHKNPDYSFRINSRRCFFVEAKKPGEDIQHQAKHAYQVRRYGWSGKLPVSILTDFEEFSVYDCTIEPKENDKAHVGRITYLTYNQYIEKFDWLWEHFSKDAVTNKQHEQLVQLEKKGNVTVDIAFLRSLDGWRAELASAIAQKNKKLSSDDINTVVQLLLNRLVFLRNCEDRGLEPYGDLRSILIKTTGNEIYKYYGMLQDRFNTAKNRYNSGLFSSQPGDVIETVKVENKVLAKIISEMYYPQSPYEFSVLSVEIMGTAYERFLGKVISVDENRNVAVDEKPEVRKAGGVFYTPQYIVDYIVEHTVGTVIKGKSPEEIAAITICDPACGSGSFLLGVYKYLIQYHEEWYQKNSKGKKNTPLTPQGNLNIEKKKEILLNNIYGVDLDEQAVEVTKLSLLLQCLEGENDSSLALQYQHVLPNINENIKSGNSLVDFDFYDDQLDFQEEKKIKPFNWQTQFPTVFKKGGFDVIVGNPPYVYLPDKKLQTYFSNKYKHQDYQQDLYLLFLERYEHILRKSGKLGVIVSNTWLQSILLRKIRTYLVTTYSWKKILHTTDRVFQDAVVDTHVLIFEKEKPKNNIIDIEKLHKQRISFSHRLPQAELPLNGDAINVIASNTERELMKKIIAKSSNAGDLCKVYNGVKPFEKGKGKPPQTEQTMKEKPFVKEDCAKPGKDWMPLLRGSLINRYKNFWNKNSWILYGEWLAAPRDPKIFEADNKIVVRQTGDSIIATIIGSGVIVRNNLHIIISEQINMNFILGLLNSKLINFYYSQINPEKGEALAEVKKKHVEQLPIFSMEKSNKRHGEIQEQIIQKVQNILQLNTDLLQNKEANKKALTEGRVAFLEQEIDKLVYELYELTDEEIQVIEESL